MFKITAYEVSDVQRPYFEKNKPENFALNLIKEKITLDNLPESEGSDGVLVTGGCNVHKAVVDQLADYGVKYIFTRSVGINNIDVEEATKKGILVANVPDYSPYAVAELAMTLGMDLFRHVAQATYHTHIGDFRILPSYFSKEIHDSTVGIIGAGSIGTTEAKMYDGLGAKVLAYQRHPDPENKAVEFVSMDELLEKSDIVSIHVPLVAGTRGMIGADELKKMKSSAILVNTARGPIVDTEAVSDAVENGEIGGYGTDVLLDEDDIMRKQFDTLDDLPDATDKELMRNYPNVIVTPHMGFFTEEAVSDMVTMSYDNFESVIKTGKPVYPVN